VRRHFVAAAAVWSFAAASRIIPAVWAGLTPGPYIVGYRELQAPNELKVSVWYPASRAGTALTLGDVFGAERDAEKAFLLKVGVEPAAVDRYLAANLFASRDAVAAAGRFPLVLVAQGNQEGPAAQAVLSEYLASLGFVIATTPSPMLREPMSSEEQVGLYAERQSWELAGAASVVAKVMTQVDAERIGLVGHSFGARAALLLAMRDERVRALVSLDGGIGTGTGLESFKRAPSFDQSRARAPVLHLYEDIDPLMPPDFRFLKSLPGPVTVERVSGLHHVHFATLGFAAAVFPELASASHAPDGVREGIRTVAHRTAEFLNDSFKIR
jgi:dienelactone hydrolase